MEILGRRVEVVQYGDWPLITAYVRLKEGDCIKKRKGSYQCFGNCDNSLVIARFIEKKPFSIKALAPQDLRVDPNVHALAKIKTLEGLESISRKPGYKLIEQNKHKTLYFNNKFVADYTPCGMSMEKELFGREAKPTLALLTERISELYTLAEKKSFEEALLDERVVNASLFDPVMFQIMSTRFGKAGEDLVLKLRVKKSERN